MGTCSQYGIMMAKLHMKTSLKQRKILTLDIVLEHAVIVVFKAQLPNSKVVALKKLHRLEAEDYRETSSLKETSSLRS